MGKRTSFHHPCSCHEYSYSQHHRNALHSTNQSCSLPLQPSGAFSFFSTFFKPCPLDNDFKHRAGLSRTSTERLYIAVAAQTQTNIFGKHIDKFLSSSTALQCHLLSLTYVSGCLPLRSALKLIDLAILFGLSPGIQVITLTQNNIFNHGEEGADKEAKAGENCCTNHGAEG